MVIHTSAKKILADLLLFAVIVSTLIFLYQKYGNAIPNLFFGTQAHYTIYIDDVALSVTVADTKTEREKGLSGVASISELEGKLFIFDTPQRHGIWMKEMQFPIDIMWFDNNMKLVYVQKNVKPDTYPEVFAPPQDTRFVLETNANLFDSVGLSLGDTLLLPSSILPRDIKQNLQQ